MKRHFFLNSFNPLFILLYIHSEFLNKNLKDGLDIDLGNGVEETEAWAESQQVETLPIEEKFLPQLHRRKKKRKSKKRTTELSANTPAAPPGFSIQVDAANDSKCN